MGIKNAFFAIIFLCALAAPALATELGVIYYHETLMTQHGEHYITRTPEGVATDMENINDIASHVKLFINPFTPPNADWVEQVNTIAKSKGLKTTITMMVDDRQLTDANWEQYRTNVLGLCERFNGKAEEFHVGNEITLHSPLAREEIKNRVVTLMADCRTKFSGTVSYQEFWYAHEVWKGHPERIYFMMYENFGTFQGNMAQLQADHPNAAIGEWGEDLLEDTVEHDEVWQKDQVQKRWDIINAANIPVAYIFTYREPNWNGFGIIRPNEQRRPLWEVFGASLNWDQPTQNTTTPPAIPPPAQNNTTPPVTPPVNETPPVNTTPPVNNTPPVTLPVNTTEVPTNTTVNETNTTEEPVVQETSRRRSGGGGRRVARPPARTYEITTDDNGDAFAIIRQNITNSTVDSTNGTNSTDPFNAAVSGEPAPVVDERTPFIEEEQLIAVQTLEEQPTENTRLARDESQVPAPEDEPEQPGFFTKVWSFIKGLFG